jgi:hypothetical protein
VVRGVIGLDGGSTSSKAVLVDEEGEIVCKAYQLSKGNPIQDTKELLTQLRDYVKGQGATLEVLGFGATGYAADVLQETLRADVNIVETVAHMMSAVKFFGDVDVICDIGGQDIKVLFMKNGDIANFRLSNSCSAGNGMLLQAMADQFGLKVTDYAETAFQAELAPKFSYGCAVFLDTDRVNFQKEGFSKEELLAGLAAGAAEERLAVRRADSAYGLARQALRAPGRHPVQPRRRQGAGRLHQGARARRGGLRAPHTGEAGALGAAFETLRVVKRKGRSDLHRHRGRDQPRVQTRNDESTVCHFCPNECKRTFIDTKRPDGSQARYIAGFSCEKGTVESEEAMLALVAERKKIAKQFPNLVDYEAQGFSALLQARADARGGYAREGRGAQEGPLLHQEGREHAALQAARRPGPGALRRTRIGMPRVLNMYSTAPYFRTYFEALGMPKQNVVFSDETTEEMWVEGGKYGSVDPCFPSKVAQAHMHNLLFHHHTEQKPLQYIFFPILTHVPSFVDGVMDKASCPIVAGAPEVMKAAFTKEVDFFAARHRVPRPCAHLRRAQPHRAAHVRHLGPAPRRHRGRERPRPPRGDAQGARSLRARPPGEGPRHPRDRRGRESGRHPHGGPPVPLRPGAQPRHPRGVSGAGVSHPVGALAAAGPGLPPALLRAGDSRGQHPLDINDVWPENYSANSAQKVWAVKFAARHPNVALLDLSSFKCGHDAPTYGIIDSIVTAAGRPTRRCTTSTPTSRRVDQDSGQDLRPLAQAPRGAPRRRRPQAHRAATLH